MIQEVTQPEATQSWSKRIGSAIDSALFTVAPEYANRRMAARRVRDVQEQFHKRRMTRLSSRDWDDDDSDERGGGGGFESARRTRTDAGFLTQNLSPNAALDLDLDSMRERSNGAYKNFEIIASHVERKVNRVAGTGIMLSPQIKEVTGKITDDQAVEWNRILRDAFERWAHKAGGRRVPLYMIEQMIIRHVEKDGAAYVQFGQVEQRDKRIPVPLRVKVVHPRRVETPPQFTSDPNVRRGIRFDADDEEIGYYVRTSHPGDNKTYTYTYDYVSAYYPNGMPRMVHIFKQREAEQNEGYPQLQVSVKRCLRTIEYEEAETERNIIASCHVGVQTGSAEPDEEAAAAASYTDSRGRLIEDMSPGRMDYRIAGDDIKFNTPPGPQGTYAAFVEHQNRMAAAGQITSYEMMSGDWRGLTYSGGRLIWIDDQPVVDCAQLDLIELFLMPLWELFVNLVVTATNLIEVSQPHYAAEPWHYERIKFVPPKRLSIDPARERRAAHADIQAGIIVHSDEVEQMNGRPAEDVYDDIEANMKLRRDKGLPLDMPQLGGTQPGDDNPATEEGSPGREKREAVGAGS
ncbi:MAG: phage portal protein [Pirellulales bacterium]